ncbi:hypothetical protein C8R44DRAFT_860277, partial [Mycena epipterygia]
MCALPTETITRIFLFTIGPSSFKIEPYAAAWNTILVSVKEARSARYVAMCIARSKSLPLDIYINCDDDDSNIDIDHKRNKAVGLVHAIFAVLDPAFCRVNHFTVSCWDEEAGGLISEYLARMDCRNLCSIWLDVNRPWMDDEDDRQPYTFTSLLPSLQRLHSTRRLPPPLRPICAQMTHLELNSISTDLQPTWSDMRLFLRALPNLEFIRLDGLYCDTHPGESQAQTLRFDRLTRIEFTFVNESMVDVMSSIIAPALAYLQLDI